MKNVILVLFILSGVTACANLTGLEHPDMVLIKTRIHKIGPWDEVTRRSNRTQIDFSMEARVHISVEDMLIGHLQKTPTSVVLRMSAHPNLDKLNQIYILAKADNNSELKILDWNYANKGLCFDLQSAQKLNIERELILLYESGKLVCPSTRNSTNKFLE